MDSSKLDAIQQLTALRLAFAEAKGGVDVWPSKQGWVAQVKDAHSLLEGAGRHNDPVTAILLAAENAAARRAAFAAARAAQRARAEGQET